MTDEDFAEIAELELYLDEVPDCLALGFAAEYSRLKLEFTDFTRAYVRAHLETYPDLKEYVQL